ncbi:MAG TPA: response regulator [Polyangiaceae bacterium]|nr:response regulator [Polyangiaceae bacterium]
MHDSVLPSARSGAPPSFSSGSDEASDDLVVVGIFAEPDAGELLRRALANSADRVSVALDLAEGLTRVSAEAPDLVFVDVTLGGNAGLAVVHHIRALSPNTAVYAVTRTDRLELGLQAVALGSQGTLIFPLSGDDVLTAVGEVRRRRAELSRRSRFTDPVLRESKAAALCADLLELVDTPSRRSAAERLASVFAERLPARRVLVYFAASAASRQLVRAAVYGESSNEPSFCDELELLRHAKAENLEVIRLALRREQLGLVLVDAPQAEGSLLATASATATLAVAVVGAREQSSRGAMKDPESSAYTFAYFVDVAGREIDIARRHGRRFALATIVVEGAGREPTSLREPTVDAAERVLSAVRDTDVLARVDANEFYLLLPETGGLGAQQCRRRVLDQLGVFARFEVAMGLANFPHDGSDLSRLLRVAKHRADACSRSVVESFGLHQLSFVELLDALLGSVVMRSALTPGDLEAPRYIELPAMDATSVAISAVREAARGGETRVVATQHAGISLGGAVRAEVTRELEGVKLDVVEVSQLAGGENADVLIIIAQQACYLMAGRSEAGLVRAVHATDPLLADLLLRRLGEATLTRLLD